MKFGTILNGNKRTLIWNGSGDLVYDGYPVPSDVDPNLYEFKGWDVVSINSYDNRYVTISNGKKKCKVVIEE